MPLSPAERKRRSRRHQAGDHSLCDPDRCEQARPSRGQRLWEQMHVGMGPAQLVLLQEACRMADRLDRLDAVLEGREWLSFQVGEGGSEAATQVTVVVDRALSEARQQATALKQLVAELRQSAPKAALPSKPLPAPERKAGGLGDLSARIAARRASPAG